MPAHRTRVVAAALALLLTIACRDGTASPSPVGTATEADDTEQYFDDLPVVLWVSRMAQPLREAPAAVTVIDADLIRASGARDLADLLRLVPGFQVVYGDTGSPLVVYHGMSDLEPKRLQVLVDGRSQYSPLFVGAVNWNVIDVQLQDIERIEVVRGTNSAAYGSNAFLGVVNVVTRHAADTSGVAASVAGGNQGVSDQSVRFGGALGEGRYRLSAERRADDGLRNIFDSRSTRRLDFRGDLPLTSRDGLEITAGKTSVELGDRASQFIPDRNTGRSSTHLQAVWRHLLDGEAETLLRASHVDERSDDSLLLDRTADLGLSTVFDYSLRAVRDEIEGQLMLDRRDARLLAGAGYRRDRSNSRQFYGTDEDVSQRLWRAFVHGEWRASDTLLASASATWEHDSLSGSSVSPRLTVNWRPARRHTLRAGAARGHRVPTLFEERAREEYFDIATGALIDSTSRSSGGLRPERIDSYEIGYLYEAPRKRVGMDLRLFDEHVRDAIVWFPVALPGGATGSADCELFGAVDLNAAFRPCGSTRDFANGADLDIRGLEYQARWEPLHGTRLTLNQAFIDIDPRLTISGVQDGSSGGGDYRQGIPRHLRRSAPQRTDTLVLQQALPRGVELFAVYSHVGSQKSSLSSEAPPFERLDWRLSWRFAGPGYRGEIAYSVQSEGKRHAERFGNQADPEANDWLYPRHWLSLALAY